MQSPHAMLLLTDAGYSGLDAGSQRLDNSDPLPYRVSENHLDKLGCAGVKLLVKLKFWVQKNFGSKKILGPKKFWV